jgi:phosphatidylglycerol:prolipoprotein diacylglycerol transferase
MAVGHAIGRWGNFINQELYGPPTTLPWGLDIPYPYRVAPYNDLATYPLETRFHPAFLYESLADLALCLLLVWICYRFRDRLREGTAFLGYVIGYSIIRFFMDYMRTDGTNAQPIAIGAIVVSLVLILLIYFVFKKPATQNEL